MKNTSFKVITDLVLQAEEVYGKSTGKTKKDFVIDSINSLVDIPFIPEFIEKKILDLAIDLTVYIFNNYIWKKGNNCDNI